MSKFASYPSLAGRVVFVSGGGSGIGASIVEHFAAQGAKVGFVDIDEAASTALVEKLGSAGYPAPLFAKCDVRDIAAYQGSVDRLATLRLEHQRDEQPARPQADDHRAIGLRGGPASRRVAGRAPGHIGCGLDVAVHLDHRVVEEEGLGGIALADPFDRPGDHARLVVDLGDVFDDAVLLDDGADIETVLLRHLRVGDAETRTFDEPQHHAFPDGQ